VKKIELMGVEFSGWVAGGMAFLCSAVEGDDAQVRAAAVGAFLTSQGMSVQVRPCYATDGSIIFVNVDAEQAV
jgi:hypothetical protein